MGRNRPEVGREEKTHELVAPIPVINNKVSSRLVPGQAVWRSQPMAVVDVMLSFVFRLRT